MKNLIQAVEQLKTNEGIIDTSIPHLKVIKTTVPHQKIHTVYTPALCFLVQGEKDVSLHDKTYTYKASEYIVTTIDLPVTGEVTVASSKKPYFCLMLEIDPVMVFEMLKDQPQTKQSAVKKGIFVGQGDEGMINAFERLVACLQNPMDVAILSPLITKEIIYRLLTSKHGESVRQLGIVGSHTQRIAKVISSIKNDYSQSLKMEKLAKDAGMSPASFHKYFKEVTSMSPLQFQKLIRLQEARRLLMTEDRDAGSVSFEVGYESPSQFSREYARMFGLPPISDVKKFKPLK